ncbi:amidase [Acetobacteraceae bacterium H6797]|nr:amidase [Acetobacteraceae bacterium H6797]
MTEIADLTATEALARISAGSLSAAAYQEACLDRIAAREPAVKAFAGFDPALAKRRAGAVKPGPLAGMPVGVKDVLDTGDQLSQYNSPLWAGHQPRADAWAVAATKAAGGYVMGKTVTTEFATRFPGPTANPHNPAHTPGGSSQGSAAGVAAGFFPLAFGTQTAGSIIRPAAFCGVVGYKPSFGLIHRAGMKVMSESLDTIGVMARSIADCALFGTALTGLDLAPGSIATAPRIALVWGPGEAKLEPSTRRLLEETAAALSRAGASLREVSLPTEVAAVQEAHPVVMNGESWQALGWERATGFEKLSEPLREVMAIAEARPREALPAARLAFARGQAAFAKWMRDYDAILTPSATGEAPEGLAWTGDPICNALWTALHGPCLTLPAGTGPKGLPLGIQLVAAPGKDAALLAVGEWVRRALG